MDIKKAEFVISNTDYKKCPAPNKPEYAFIGRSNVGKSSIINRLVNQNKLAKVSASPGKTQLINHFMINDSWYLVDLPGYGYAKVSKKKRIDWQKFIQDYIQFRENLYCLFVLIDSRLEPQKIDLEFMGWLGYNQVPFALIFTKSDKLPRTKLKINIDFYKKQLLNAWEELPEIFITSAETGLGRDEVLDFIDRVNQSQSESGNPNK